MRGLDSVVHMQPGGVQRVIRAERTRFGHHPGTVPFAGRNGMPECDTRFDFTEQLEAANADGSQHGPCGFAARCDQAADIDKMLLHELRERSRKLRALGRVEGLIPADTDQ